MEAADPDQVFNLIVRHWRSFGFLPAPERVLVVLEDGRIGVHPRPLDPQDQASKSDCSDSHRDGLTGRRPRREHRTSVRHAREVCELFRLSSAGRFRSPAVDGRRSWYASGFLHRDLHSGVMRRANRTSRRVSGSLTLLKQAISISSRRRMASKPSSLSKSDGGMLSLTADHVTSKARSKISRSSGSN